MTFAGWTRFATPPPCPWLASWSTLLHCSIWTYGEPHLFFIIITNNGGLKPIEINLSRVLSTGVQSKISSELFPNLWQRDQIKITRISNGICCLPLLLFRFESQCQSDWCCWCNLLCWLPYNPDQPAIPLYRVSFNHCFIHKILNCRFTNIIKTHTLASIQPSTLLSAGRTIFTTPGPRLLGPSSPTAATRECGNYISSA